MVYSTLLKSVTLAILCLSSCHTEQDNNDQGKDSTRKPSTLPSLELKKQWRLISYGGDTAAFAAMYPMQPPYIVIDSAQSGVYGNTGCNAFGGTANVKGDSLRFITPFEMTAIGCPGEGEEKFTRFMARVSRYLMKADTLVLMERDTPIMSFIKKP
ncbi:MAG: lipase [Chitinophagaceae bacterium]|jgi:heat shock protein HslJ|nr:lipase [Chitinophagaceae bacterium]